MATLKEYYENDFGNVFTMHGEIRFECPQGVAELIIGVHYDFLTATKFYSMYLDNKVSDLIFLSDFFESPVALESVGAFPNVRLPLAKNFAGRVNITNDNGPKISVESNGITVSGNDLPFIGRVIVYHTFELSSEFIDKCRNSTSKFKLNPMFRGPDYREKRQIMEKPLAFICHDSRDKIEVARKVASGLTKFLIPVWYDEYSLKVGDRLRESIENGIRQCRKCILIISPNFIANPGWTKTEFDSIFTRELIEKKDVILPIWHNVTPAQVYEYSPSLANRTAILWTEGDDVILTKLAQVILADN